MRRLNTDQDFSGSTLKILSETANEERKAQLQEERKAKLQRDIKRANEERKAKLQRDIKKPESNKLQNYMHEKSNRNERSTVKRNAAIQLDSKWGLARNIVIA